MLLTRRIGMSHLSARILFRSEKARDIEVFKCDQARRAENHHEDEQERNDDPLENLQRPEGFTEETDAYGADNGSVNGVQPPEVHHSQDFGKVLNAEG